MSQSPQSVEDQHKSGRRSSNPQLSTSLALLLNTTGEKQFVSTEEDYKFAHNRFGSAAL